MRLCDLMQFQTLAKGNMLLSKTVVLTLRLLRTTIVPYATSLDPDETPRLTQIQAVCHSDDIFTNFVQH